MAGSISAPGVEVTQEFVTTSPTVLEPTLPTVIVGPAFQIVSAFDDEGNPLAEAYAGTYRDGFGTVSYDLPGLAPQASLVGFSDEIRVFLVLADEVTELNPVSGEEEIDSGAAGVLTASGPTFTHVGALWLQIGVEVGDVVRFDYRGETLDLEIASVDTDSQVTLTGVGPIVESSLSGLAFSIVRNPAQFVFSAGTQANAEVGTDTDFLRLSVLSTSSFAGSLGDDLSVEAIDSPHYADGPDGACGDGIFSSAAAAFGASVGTVGTYPTDKYLFVGTTFGPLGANTRSLKQILSVVTPFYLTVETGLGTGLSAQTYRVGTGVASGSNGATDGAGTLFTSAGANFLTSIPNAAGVPSSTTFIEIGSDGVYEISNIPSATTLTLTSAATAGLSGQDYQVVAQTATNTDGATGALTDFASASGGFNSIPNTAGTPDQSTYISRGQAAGLNRQIATIVTDKRVTLASGFAASFSSSVWQAVDEDAPLTLTFDPVLKKITVQIARVNGASSSTYAAISDAINLPADPSYNATVSAIVSAAVVGSGTVLGTDVAYGASPIVRSFDGGSDEYDLLLDADLLGSPTPTAKVYVSYKALRVDMSQAATTPKLWSFDSVTALEAEGEISVSNPGLLGVYFALLNSPARSVKFIGIDEVTATKPEGTAEAYARALEFLESKDVYTIAVMTQDPTVHGLLQTHVNAMSAPTEKSERIGFFSTPMPLYTSATVVASGDDGNTGASFDGDATAEFSASVNFTAAGVQAGDILVVTSLATSTDSDVAVNGTNGPLYGLTVVGVKAGDDFVLEVDASGAGVTAAWNSLIDVAFTVYRAGTAISQAVDQSEEIAKVGEAYADRRMFHHWPPEVTADIGGTASIVKGTNLAAAWAGKVGASPTESGFSTTAISGFTGVKYSSGYFSNAQLNRMAGGGTYITIQESSNGPLSCRHQLSTDVSSVQKRELSVTKNLDYIAKYFRIALKKPIGKFNITQSFLDALATTVQGLLRALQESRKIIEGRLSSIAVNDVDPTKIDIVVVVVLPLPANYIALTIQI